MLRIATIRSGTIELMQNAANTASAAEYPTISTQDIAVHVHCGLPPSARQNPSQGSHSLEILSTLKVSPSILKLTIFSLGLATPIVGAIALVVSGTWGQSAYQVAATEAYHTDPWRLELSI